MKKIYINSINDLKDRRIIEDINNLEKIANLFIFDLDNSLFYYLTKNDEKLKYNKEDIYIDNKFITECLKDSHYITEDDFNYLVNMKCNQFYSIKKNDLLKDLKLEEWII